MLMAGIGENTAHAAEDCSAPDPVCAAQAAVFQIGAFDPFGSAVRIAPDMLVSNRHVVADETTVKITLANGSTIDGEAIPTTFAGDLILIRAALPEGPFLAPAKDFEGSYYTVGFDLSRKAIGIFKKGDLLLKPAEGKPYARLYHTAQSQPGVSGGALVNADGKLVAIATSGGEGRNEAIPASQISMLKESSGPEHKAASLAIGRAYRECTILVDKARRSRDTIPPGIAKDIDRSCSASGNRQLYDLAGQIFGISRMFDQSISYFQRSLDKDPNAINTRLSIVVILSFAQRYKDAADHVRWLLTIIPENQEVQRFAVRVGKSIEDKAMVARGLKLIEIHNPGALEAAKRFIDAPARTPKRN